MHARDIANETREIARLESTLVDAYDLALDKIADPRIADPLRRLRLHHVERAEYLRRAHASGSDSGVESREWFERYLRIVTDSVDRASRRDDTIGSLRMAEAALAWRYSQLLEHGASGELEKRVHDFVDEQQEHLGFLSMAEQIGRI